LKIRVFLGWSKFVSACVERDKKNFKKFDFCLRLYAEMIENLSVELRAAIVKMGGGDFDHFERDTI